MEKIGFDSLQYEEKQREAVWKRWQAHPKHTLYLEIGGKLIEDDHAARVLPGFDSHVKTKVLRPLAKEAEILFCVNCEDLMTNRVINQHAEPYQIEVMKTIRKLETAFGIEPSICLNFFPEASNTLVNTFQRQLSSNYQIIRHYRIDSYGENPQALLGPEGFSRDQHYNSKAGLVIVTGVASNSGKLGAIFSQLFSDNRKGKLSTYAKYELFPIHNLALNHPVNLAYEAATAELGDENLIDHFHEEAYHTTATTYNRDLESFSILQQLLSTFADADHPLHQYLSPTSLTINEAGGAIINDHIVAEAAVAEIKRRRDFFQHLAETGQGDYKPVQRCQELLNEAKNYFAK